MLAALIIRRSGSPRLDAGRLYHSCPFRDFRPEWTLPPPDSPYGALVLEAFRANGLQLPRTVVVSTLPVRSALLATGRFLSMAPRVVLQFPTKNQLLRGVPIDLPTTLRPLALVTLKNRNLNPVAQLVTEWAREAARPLVKRGSSRT